jgi:hypothetical protein
MAHELMYWPLDRFDVRENIVGQKCFWKDVDVGSLRPGPFGAGDCSIERHIKESQTCDYPNRKVLTRFTIIIWVFGGGLTPSQKPCDVCAIQIRSVGSFLLILGITLRGIGSRKNVILDLYELGKARLKYRLEMNTWFKLVISYEKKRLFAVQFDDRPKQSFRGVVIPESDNWYFFFGRATKCKSRRSKFLFVNDTLNSSKLDEYKSWIEGEYIGFLKLMR